MGLQRSPAMVPGSLEAVSRAQEKAPAVALAALLVAGALLEVTQGWGRLRIRVQVLEPELVLVLEVQKDLHPVEGTGRVHRTKVAETDQQTAEGQGVVAVESRGQ